MLRYDNFTIKVQEALMSARSLAEENNNQQILSFLAKEYHCL